MTEADGKAQPSESACVDHTPHVTELLEVGT